MKHAEFASLETSGVFALFDAVTTGFDTDHLHIFVIEKRMEQPDGVGTATDAGDKQIGKTLFAFHDLGTGFDSDDAMKVAHHHGVGMRAQGTAKNVMSVAHVGDPVAKRFVNGFLQGLLASFNSADIRSEQFHADDIEVLTLHVNGAHVNDTFEPETGRYRRGGDAVLTGPGFSDNAFLAKSLGEEDLTQRVVDLVGSGMKQVLTLEVNLGATKFLRPALG